MSHQVAPMQLDDGNLPLFQLAKRDVPAAVRLALLLAVVFAVASIVRIGSGVIPPFDDLYHLKRIEWSAAHFPAILGFDCDRGVAGAYCPWPPMYDLLAGGVDRVFGGVTWLPPLFFAFFAAGVTAAVYLVARRAGSERRAVAAAATAGLTLAASPYLIGIAQRGHIDHHYVEPLLLLLIAGATASRRGVLLGFAIAAALLVQTALLVAAAIAFVSLFFDFVSRGGSRKIASSGAAGSIAFAIAAAIIVLYRLTRPPGYPDSEWFLGWPHVAALAGAAVACAATRITNRGIALAAGIVTALAVPSFAPAFFGGIGFFRGDPWLRTILEFQPMFHQPWQYGTDLANLTGGAVLGLLLFRRYPAFALFSAAYLVLALSSRRFLVPAIALFAIGGALAVVHARGRALATAAAAVTLLPPVAFDLYAGIRAVDHNAVYRLASDLRTLPRGRVLGPWSFGHAIDVIGHRPVLVDNFGSMPDEFAFQDAADALRLVRTDVFIDWCRSRGVRYVVLTDPDRGLGSDAAVLGLSPTWYDGTRLGRRTLWWRLYHDQERNPAFRRVREGVVGVWEIRFR